MTTEAQTPSAHAEKLTAVTEAVVKAVPDVQLRRNGTIVGTMVYSRDIALEDVLRALWHGEDTKYISIHPHREKCCAVLKMKVPETVGAMLGLRKEAMKSSFAKWNLGKPLDQQSEETISFLYDLVCS